MGLEGKLGKLSLASESTTKEKLDTDLVKVDKLDTDTKKTLEEKLLKSDVGETLKKMIDEIATKDTQDKKTAFVDLLKNLFEKDMLKRVVVDGKNYVRLAMGDDIFDIELADTLIPSLIDRYIEWTTAKVNEGVEDDQEKIKVTYEKLVIEETQEKLDALKNDINTPIKKDFWKWETFKADPSGRVKGFGPWVKDTVNSVKEFFTELPSIRTTLRDAFGGIKNVFSKK